MKINSTLHILILDDCNITNKQIKLALRKKGFSNIEAASNGADALSSMIKSRNNKNHIELLLLDWNMPKLNGLEFLKKVREVPEFSKLPIIMISANDKNSDVEHALKHGANGYVKKPVIIGELYSEIVKVCGVE